MYLPPIRPGQVRVGVSLPVPQPWAAEISAARISYGDEFAEMIPPHITIVGPTAVWRAEIPNVIKQLDVAVSHIRRFSVSLRGTGTFRPLSEVVFINIDDGAANCAELEAACNTGLLANAPRFPYHPHVTLAHDVPPAQLDRATSDFAALHARFTADALWLYRQSDDGEWRKACRFELRR